MQFKYNKDINADTLKLFVATVLTKEPGELSVFEEHFILNLKNSRKGNDCSLKICLVKLYTHNHFVSQNSTVFSIHALIVDKTLLPMIVYFAIGMLPHLCYCIIVSNKYIMSKNPFSDCRQIAIFWTISQALWAEETAIVEAPDHVAALQTALLLVLILWALLTWWLESSKMQMPALKFNQCFDSVPVPHGVWNKHTILALSGVSKDCKQPRNDC